MRKAAAVSVNQAGKAPTALSPNALGTVISEASALMDSVSVTKVSLGKTAASWPVPMTAMTKAGV